MFLPNCLQDKIIFAITFAFDVDNTSDHQPIILKLNYHSTDVQLSAEPDSVSNLKQKINWSKFNQAFIQANYVTPLLSEIAKIDCVDLNHTDELSELITTTVNDLISARGAYLIFHSFGGALIGVGRLLERGAYFKILKNRNSDFSFAFQN